MLVTKKITILLIILAVTGAGVLVYKIVIKKSAAPQPVTAPTVDQIKQQEFNDALKQVTTSDQDLDGISDIEEAAYKTSVTSSDTDEDGLTDWQEIFNYKTNPLKADTDGDNSTDGYEARRGLNPNEKNKIVK